MYPYCGITCAAEAGALGEPKQNAKPSNKAMIQEEDSAWRGFNYMAMAGITHVEMLEEVFSLGYSKEFSNLLQDLGFIMEQFVKA